MTPATLNASALLVLMRIYDDCHCNFLPVQPHFGSCSPLQFIGVVRKGTLPHHAETQDRHQVSVKSCIVLRAEKIYSTAHLSHFCKLNWADMNKGNHVWTRSHWPHSAPACGCCRWCWRGFWGSLWYAERLPVRWVVLLGPACTHTAPSTEPPSSSPVLLWGWTHPPPGKAKKKKWVWEQERSQFRGVEQESWSVHINIRINWRWYDNKTRYSSGDCYITKNYYILYILYTHIYI